MIGKTNSSGGSGSADKSQIFVTAPSGSIVTCSNDSKIFKAPEKNGQWRFKNLDLGKWVLKAEKDGRTTNKEVVFNRLEIVYKTLEYFSATLTVSIGPEMTCECEQNGISIVGIKIEPGKVKFIIPSPGNWTIIGKQEEKVKTKTIEIIEDKGNYTDQLYIDFIIYRQNIITTMPYGLVSAYSSYGKIETVQEDTEKNISIGKDGRMIIDRTDYGYAPSRLLLLRQLPKETFTKIKLKLSLVGVSDPRYLQINFYKNTQDGKQVQLLASGDLRTIIAKGGYSGVNFTTDEILAFDSPVPPEADFISLQSNNTNPIYVKEITLLN